MVAIFFLKNIYEILGALLFIVLILLSARLSIIKAIKGLKPLLMLSVFIFVFQIFFNKDGKELLNKELYFSISSIVSIVVLIVLCYLFTKYTKLSFLSLLIFIFSTYYILRYLTWPKVLTTFNLKIYESGLNTALFVLFRLITVVFLATILTLTTKPTDLTLGMERLLKPLKVIKINPEEIALIISIALRYIPTILDEAYKIMDAQAARGADFKSGNLIRRIKILVSLLVPMFVISFERSDELADAMLSRNFVPGKPKTKYHILKWRIIDSSILILSMLLLGGSIWLYIIF